MRGDADLEQPHVARAAARVELRRDHALGLDVAGGGAEHQRAVGLQVGGLARRRPASR